MKVVSAYVDELVRLREPGVRKLKEFSVVTSGRHTTRVEGLDVEVWQHVKTAAVLSQRLAQISGQERKKNNQIS